MVSHIQFYRGDNYDDGTSDGISDWYANISIIIIELKALFL